MNTIDPHMQQENPYQQHINSIPQIATKKPFFKRAWLWIFLVLAVITVSVVWYLQMAFNDNMETARQECMKSVSNKAKYPGGVSFPDPVEMETEQGITDFLLTYTAAGLVDFPNGFGTPVRGMYTCDVKISDGEVTDSSATFINLSQ